MPIEINEIRVIATVTPPEQTPNRLTPSAPTPQDKAKWIQEAVEEVLRVLAEKKER